MSKSLSRHEKSAVDCCVIGGGVIGLSIARELAGRGLQVRVLTDGPARSSCSWAAAGILPPAPECDSPPGDALTARSDRLHRQWAAELLEETGIDNGLRACGGLHLAADAPAVESLRSKAEAWRCRGATAELLAPREVADLEPALAEAVSSGRIAGGMLLPEETQIRPPRQLEALAASCRRRGVKIVEAAGVEAIETRGDSIAAVRTPLGVFAAERWVLAAGAWSQKLAEGFGVTIETRPVRGQIALVRPTEPLLWRVINLGLDYLVPRPDGRILAGSTIEDIGYDPRTTPEVIERLLAMARGLVPALAHAELEASWSGLRPGSPDGLPYLGLSPRYANGYLAAGHFRAGLHQSTGTAELIADLMTEREPALDPAPFAPGRSRESGRPDAVAMMVEAAAAVTPRR